MSETRWNATYEGGRARDGRSHLWLQAVQDTLAERLVDIVPREMPAQHERPAGPDPKVITIGPAAVSDRKATFIERLKQRKVVQWLLAYLAMTWMVLQVNDALADVWAVPLVAQRAGSLALGVGVLPALVVAWYHGEKGRQRICCGEVGLVGLTLAVAVAAVWQVCFA